MAFTAQDVKKLREMTNVGMMDCKKALQACDGDMDKAVDWLREKGLAKAAKKADRIAAEGVAYATVIDGVGVVIEVNSETDFAAKSDAFKGFVTGLLETIIEKKPADVAALMAADFFGTTTSVQNTLVELIAVIKENLSVRRFILVEGTTSTYIHGFGTTGVIVSAHTSLCCAPIYENGTEEQKRKYLPDLLSGRKLGAFGLTEPNAGTDASGQQTTAVLDESGENYILNGTKCFITNGNVAETFVVFAMTDKSKGNKGISAFIVEKSFPGFSTGKHEKKMGIRGSSTCDLIFEDCIVPKENLLGKEGKGFAIAMKTLDGGRIGIASQALGLGEGAVEEAIKYTKERVQFGKRISQFQNTQFQLADMHTKMQAAQFLVYSAALKKMEHAKNPKVSYSMDAAMAKLFAAEAASDVTRRAVQLFGGYGYTREYPVERMMRDAKITEIYEGTSEVQRIVISANMGL